MTGTPARPRRANYLTLVQHDRLDRWGWQVRLVLGFTPYLVGSAISRPDWRDVDVRCVPADDEYDRLAAAVSSVDRLSLALAAWGTIETGLPIDFQIQRRTEANAEYDGERHALGLRSPKVERGGPEPYNPAPGDDGVLRFGDGTVAKTFSGTEPEGVGACESTTSRLHEEFVCDLRAPHPGRDHAHGEWTHGDATQAPCPGCGGWLEHSDDCLTPDRLLDSSLPLYVIRWADDDGVPYLELLDRVSGGGPAVTSLKEHAARVLAAHPPAAVVLDEYLATYELVIEASSPELAEFFARAESRGLRFVDVRRLPTAEDVHGILTANVAEAEDPARG